MGKQNFYFTFGCGMGLSKHYVIIKAHTEYGARDRMVELFGKHWCTSYNEERWQEPEGGTQAEKWGYKLFKTFEAYDYPNGEVENESN